VGRFGVASPFELATRPDSWYSVAMDGSGYQTPADWSVVTLPTSRMVRANLCWRQRLAMRGIDFKPAGLTTVNARSGRWSSGCESLIELSCFVFIKKLRVFVIRHFWYTTILSASWGGYADTRTHASALMFFRLTGSTEVPRIVAVQFHYPRNQRDSTPHSYVGRCCI
jgi:hypothetical protein